MPTYRRKAYKKSSDGNWKAINLPNRGSVAPADPPFFLGVTEPVYYREGGLASDAGPYAARNASTTDAGIAGIIPGVSRTNLDLSVTPINWNTTQDLSNLNISGGRLQIVGPNHRLSNILMTGSNIPAQGPGTALTPNGGWIDCQPASCSNIYIEHTTVRPTYPNDRMDGFYGHDYHAYRCLVEHTVDAYSAANKWAPNVNVRLEGCWGGNFSWFSDDRQADGGHSDGTHNDFCQHHSGNYLTINGCTIWGYKWNALNGTNGSGGTTPLAYNSGNSSNRWPQCGQIITQTAAYFHVGNDTINNNFLYGADTALLAGSVCAIHTTKYGHNVVFLNNTWGNDDHRDYGGTVPTQVIRTDNFAGMTINGTAYGGGTFLAMPDADNNKYSSNSDADRKYNVTTIKRGTSVKVKGFAV